jgi:hypothetical protein
MACFHPGRFVWGLVIGLWPLSVHAQEQYRYHYVDLDTVPVPSGLTFFPAALRENGQVYGEVCDATGVCSIAFYDGGTVTVLGAQGFATVVNAGGTIGGGVANGQAALFREDHVELVPPQPNAAFSVVISLNDPGTALVASLSFNPFLQTTVVLFSKGSVTPIDFGPKITSPQFLITGTANSRFLNNEGIIAATTGDLFNDARGFRFDPRTGEAMLLDPVAPDTLAWGLRINSRGDVLGYSFVNSSPYHERVGVWDRAGNFHTYIDETISTSGLVFNDNNLIVITLAPGDASYLVPKPGLRLNLSDLVEDLPPGATLRDIHDMNNHGDLLGQGAQGDFLLTRLR